MQAKGIPAMLVSQIDNVQWATGFNGSNGFLVLTPTQELFITDSRYTLQAQRQVSGTRVESYSGATDANTFIAEHVRSLGIDRVGF